MALLDTIKKLFGLGAKEEVATEETPVQESVEETVEETPAEPVEEVASEEAPAESTEENKEY